MELSLRVVNVFDRDEVADLVSSSSKFEKTVVNVVTSNSGAIQQGQPTSSRGELRSSSHDLPHDAPRRIPQRRHQSRDERLVAIEGMLARAEQTPGVTLILQEATLDQVNDAVREAAFKWWLHAMLTILDALPAILGSTPYGRQK